MARKREVFLTESVKKKTMQFRIDPKLEEELGRLDRRIETEAPTLKFDRHAVVEVALRRAIEAVNAQLDDAARDRREHERVALGGRDGLT